MKINKVVADTNALIYCVQKKKDIFRELAECFGNFEIIVLKKVKKELEKKAAYGKAKASAKIALELIKKMKTVNYRGVGERTDDTIMDYAAENDAYVFTYDKKLKARCKKKGVKLAG